MFVFRFDFSKCDVFFRGFGCGDPRHPDADPKPWSKLWLLLTTGSLFADWSIVVLILSLNYVDPKCHYCRLLDSGLSINDADHSAVPSLELICQLDPDKVTFDFKTGSGSLWMTWIATLIFAGCNRAATWAPVRRPSHRGETVQPLIFDISTGQFYQFLS